MEYRSLGQSVGEGRSMGKVIISGTIAVCAALILAEIIGRLLTVMGR
jgi:hypothetical protein